MARRKDFYHVIEILLLALLCGQARAQTVNPAQTAAPTAAATETATSSGTATAPAVDLSSSAAGGATPAAAAPKAAAPPPNPIRVKIHKEAASWRPVSVRSGGDPLAARDSFSWRLKKAKGKKGAYAGKTSKAKAVARLYKAGDDVRLVISVFPQKLAEQRTHVELRFLVIEGYLEKAEIAAVAADDGGAPLDDAGQLEQKGVGFQEEAPASGKITLSAVDARPSRSALNAGTLTLASFAESELNPKSLGNVSLSWSVKGVEDKRKK